MSDREPKSGEDPADKNLLMMCTDPNPTAFRQLPPSYHPRNCRKVELDVWLAMPFDSPQDAERYREYMSAFFDRVCAPKGEAFFQQCRFVCNSDDVPVGTGFIWKIYDEIHTLHWLKVLRDFQLPRHQTVL